MDGRRFFVGWRGWRKGAAGRGLQRSGEGAGTLSSRRRGGVSTRVSLDDLSLHATQLPPGQFSILFSGTTPIAPGLAFGDGLLCVGGSLHRFEIHRVTADGGVSWGPDLDATGGWSPGDTRYFQCWHRDGAGAPCSSGYNLSAALELAFLP